jgi:hypothetical protein
VGPDAREFLARLVRLDPAALVRMRPEGEGALAWAMLPFRVLVSWSLPTVPARDSTLRAADLLAGSDADGTAAPRRDREWRWPLPSAPGRVVERIPTADVIRLAAAAARTVRAATTEGIGGRAVGERMLRDAVLDHVSIVVTTNDGQRAEIRQRLVQAVVRMGFLGRPGGAADSQRGPAEQPGVAVRLAMGWIGLEARHGSAWYRPISPLRLG